MLRREDFGFTAEEEGDDENQQKSELYDEHVDTGVQELEYDFISYVFTRKAKSLPDLIAP